MSTIPPLTALTPGNSAILPKKPDSPEKVHDAAQQFEALLLGQILETVRQGGGWLGSGEDSASSSAGGLAEQQLAVMLAKQGGFGLSALIEKGLRRD